MHGTLAVLFFLSIAYVCLFRARDTLSLVDDPARRDRYDRSYKSLGTLMVVSPLAAMIVSDFFTPTGGQSSRVFYIEAFGAWAFAAYWFVKSRECVRRARSDAPSPNLSRGPNGTVAECRMMPDSSSSKRPEPLVA